MVKKNTKIESYDHKQKKRVNNPPIGLVSADTDPDEDFMTYSHDPHIDPQLVWAKKNESFTFEVPTVSLHVHERIDPCAIIDAVRNQSSTEVQPTLFESDEENLPIRKAIEFYQHRQNWSNRLIAGDSLLVMNSMLNKEGMGGKIQTIYIDPPYGINYGSNFQPKFNNLNVRDNKDSNLTAEPEQIRAFRDTWELGIHSYLSYLQKRLILARDLLKESGSCFVQMGRENAYFVAVLMDEIFGTKNRMSTISYATTSGSSTKYLPEVANYLLWYAKDREKVKYRQLFEKLDRREIIDLFSSYAFVETEKGEVRKLTEQECFDPDKYLDQGDRIFSSRSLLGQGHSTTGRSEPFQWKGKKYYCGENSQWSISKEGLEKLAELNRLDARENSTSLRWKAYENEVPGRQINNFWSVQMYPSDKMYVVQTSNKVIQRALLMTSDPGDIVFDPTCGSGTTAYVAEQWGRRWITCDTSRVALAIARQRLVTSRFSYFKLSHEKEGVDSGFELESVETVSASSIGYEEPPKKVELYDQPIIENSKIRVTGPFTVEAVPAPTALSINEISNENEISTSDVKMSTDIVINNQDNETDQQEYWKEQLFVSGIRGRDGQRINFSRLETKKGTKWIHATGEAQSDKDGESRIVVVSFGPDFAPLEQRQVEKAIEEARQLVPKPDIMVFAAFQFDPEASKDIDETKWPNVTLLKAQMSTDLLTDDLKSKSKTNEGFWLIGQPDVTLEKVSETDEQELFEVSVIGFDYFNIESGEVESGDVNRIAMWMLDPNYDGRSIFPRQLFFPNSDTKSGWTKLAKNLKSVINTELIEKYSGTTSLPFKPGEHCRAAVKIIDDRGVESFKVLELE